MYPMMRFSTDAAQKGYGSDVYGWNYHPMSAWMQGNATFLYLHTLFALVSWALLIILLIALIRWLWKKGDNETKRR